MSALSYTNPSAHFPVLRSDGLKESNRTNAKMSFVPLICKTGFFCAGASQSLSVKQKFCCSSDEELWSREEEKRSKDRDPRRNACVCMCGGGPGDSVPSAAAGGVRQRWHLQLKGEHSLPHQQLLSDSALLGG